MVFGRKDEKGAYPWGFVVGDFNKDGKLDVAAGKKTTWWCRGYSDSPRERQRYIQGPD